MGQILAQAEAVDRTESRLQRHDERARGLWRDAWKRLRENKAAVVGLFYIAFMVLVAIFGPMLAPHDPNFIPFDARANTPPFWMEGSDSRFPLGTDSLARDFLSRLLYGARISMIVGLIPTIITMLIGVSYGLISGWMGGRADNLLMRLVDVVYAFPSLLLFIIMQASLRDTTLGRMLGGLMLLFVAFAITGWNGMARLVRGQVLSVREMEYVEAARAMGGSSRRIVLRHILPNCLAPVIVSVSFSIPSYILAEASLSFLGIGIRPPNASWGSMVFTSFPLITFQPIFVIMPSVLIALIMIAFAFVGDGLRDALDPQGGGGH
jgi:oligopeptide transport system permease protein